MTAPRAGGGGGGGPPRGRARRRDGARIRPLSELPPRATLARPAAQRRSPRARVFLREAALFGSALLIYLTCGAGPWSHDTLPARYLPLSLLAEGDFDLDEFPSLRSGNAYYLVHAGGRWLSYYPIATAVLAAPVYAPFVLTGVGDAASVRRVEWTAAAVLVALSAVLVHLTARRLTDRRTAFLIAIVYAFGSTSWSLSGQALWQHTGTQLALAAALYALVRGTAQPMWLALAGFPLAMAVACRISTALATAPFAVFVLMRERGRWWRFALAAAPPLLLLLTYNWAYFGSPLQDSGFGAIALHMTAIPSRESLAGLLLSPGRGLFVYSPVFVVSAAGLLIAWKSGGDPLLRCAGVGVALTFLVSAAYPVWWAGATYGPRYLADVSPLLALGLVPLAPRIARRRRFAALVLLLGALSVTAHAIGATSLWSHSRWSREIDPDGYPRRLWWWRDNQLVNPLREFVATAAVALRGQPTSRDGGRIGASFNPPGPVLPRETPIDGPAQVRVCVTNVGEAAWLARGCGAVELRWTWRKPEGQSLAAGRRPLRYTVLPGSTYDFYVPVVGPLRPGVHVLEAAIGVGGVASSARARWPVHVTEGGLRSSERRDANVSAVAAVP